MKRGFSTIQSGGKSLLESNASLLDTFLNVTSKSNFDSASGISRPQELIKTHKFQITQKSFVTSQYEQTALKHGHQFDSKFFRERKARFTPGQVSDSIVFCILKK